MHTDSHITDSLYTSYSQIHRAVVQYSSTTTGEIHVIIPTVTGLDTSIPVSYFGREAHPFENDWVVPNVGASIIVCREDEDYTSVFWINTTYNPVRADVGESNPSNYNFGPSGSESIFDLSDWAGHPTSAGLYLGSIYMGFHTGSNGSDGWRTYMDYTGKFYLKGSGTNTLTWDGSTLAVTGTVTATAGEIGGWTIDADSMVAGTMDASGYADGGGITISSGGSIHAKQFYIDTSGNAFFKGDLTGANITGTTGTFTGSITGASGTFTGSITGASGTFTGSITGASGTFGGALSGASISAGTISGAAITAGSINVPAISPKFTVADTGAVTASDLTLTGTVTATSGIINGAALVGGTITGSTILVPGTGADADTLMRVSNSGTTAFLELEVEDQTVAGYIAINRVTSPSVHSNLQILAPAMEGSTRPGMTIKHYVGGGSYVNIGSDDSNPQILLEDTGTGTATIRGDGAVSIESPDISLGTADTHFVSVPHNGIELENSAPSTTTNRLYNQSGTLKWDGSAVGGGTTYTFSSPLSESSGTVSIDLSGYSTTSHNHSGVYATSSHNHSGTYLELGGGTMTGTLNLGTGTKRIEGGSGGGLMIDSSGSAYLRANNEANYGVTAWTGGHTTIYNGTTPRIVTATSYNICYEDWVPDTTDEWNLGFSTGALKWKNLYLSNNVYTHDGGVHVSDVSQKTDVVDSILGLDFINAVRPVSYKWVETEGRSGVRTHHGFIAQEIEAVLGDDATAMALWCNVHQPALAAEELPEGQVMAAVDESYTQSLRYTELVPVITKALQEISTKLDAAEARIAVLESA